MATYDRTWLDHARGHSDEIDANPYDLRMIAGEYVPSARRDASLPYAPLLRPSNYRCHESRHSKTSLYSC